MGVASHSLSSGFLFFGGPFWWCAKSSDVFVAGSEVKGDPRDRLFLPLPTWRWVPAKTPKRREPQEA